MVLFLLQLEAFRVPLLKKEIEKVRLSAEKERLSCLQLEEKLSDEKARHFAAVEEERERYRAEITALIEQHRNTIAELKNQHEEAHQRLRKECQDVELKLTKEHEGQLQNLRIEYNKLQRTHAETLVILREENDAIREEIDDKNIVIEKLKRYKIDGEKLKRDLEIKELSYKEQLQIVNEENFRLKNENETLLNYSKDDGNSSIQEVQSLRAVLELKLSDVAELRKSLAKASEKADQLPLAEEKIASLTAKCEDLMSQLERKNTIEQQIILDKSKLEESLTEEVNQNKRLKQRNEELQWKVQQNREILNRIFEQAEEGGFNRSNMSSSFNERYLTTGPIVERTPLFKEKTNNKSTNSGDIPSASRKSKNSCELDMMDYSPPSSPKVKGVVEKSDSVSYVLEMDESPDVAASRILRRSFRNSTPPKNTPTKSPSNKTQKPKANPLSLSASTSAIVPMLKSDHMRSRSISVRNGDYDNNTSNNDDVFVWRSRLCSSTPNEKGICDDISDNFMSCNLTNCKLDNNQTYRSYNLGSYKLEDHLDLDDENDVDIKLPSLPSEIGRTNDMQSLPAPKHLAGEAMLAESNSDEESTTSSSSGQL
ncbi:dynactin 1-related microtubule-binding [Holotrichia oblita]|uniref:Dynactin 1-related microtubule-binding n=1 Tax=Holotrichia oblita TaxID=644536 RepID=A0ACB9T2S3_HOLOL|nr:dynactin 1-related microtubule-binding [Holotrichia oblita]